MKCITVKNYTEAVPLQVLYIYIYREMYKNGSVSQKRRENETIGTKIVSRAPTPDDDSNIQIIVSWLLRLLQ